MLQAMISIQICSWNPRSKIIVGPGGRCSNKWNHKMTVQTVYGCSSFGNQTAVQRWLSLHIAVICEKVLKLSSNVFLSIYKYSCLTGSFTVQVNKNMCTFESTTNDSESQQWQQMRRQKCTPKLISVCNGNDGSVNRTFVRLFWVHCLHDDGGGVIPEFGVGWLSEDWS